MDFKGRQAQLRTLFDTHRLDALLVSHLPNIRYLCGFTGSAGALLVTQAESRFFTDGRYTEQSRKEVVGAKIAVGKKGPLAAVADWLPALVAREPAPRWCPGPGS